MIRITIRPERDGDQAAISELIQTAFSPMSFADGDEHELVERLRREGDLALSLVAIDDAGSIVGHVGFSPATINHVQSGWFQMAPVSVCPEIQRQGIGSALICAGIAELTLRGALGVAVVGNPAYYERFGFVQTAVLTPPREHDAPFFRAQALQSEIPSGMLRYAPAFG